MVKLAVVYYSATGTLHALAQAAVAAGEQAGAQVRLRKAAELAPPEAIAANPRWQANAAATADIEEASLADLRWADAIMFGAPTRYGLPAAQLKQFIDTTGGLWSKGELVNKVGSSFTATSTAHGGQESTILAINNVFYHWGVVIVPPGYADPVQFETGNPYGTSHTSGGGKVPPGDAQLRAMAFQTRRVVEVTAALLAGGLQSYVR